MRNLKKTLLATVLAGLVAPAFAAEFYVVVPVKNRTSPAKVTLQPYILPAGVKDVAYAGFDFNSVLAVTNDPNYTPSWVSWHISSGALPAGMTLNSKGVLGGTPTQSGPASFEVTATYQGKSGLQTYSLAVDFSVELQAATLPTGKVNKAYSYDLKTLFSASGAPYNVADVAWSLSSGILPPGLTLSSSGVISGTPTDSTTRDFTVAASYAGLTAAQSYQIRLPMYAGAVSPTAVVFEGTLANTSETKTVTLTSSGSAALSITSKAVTGTFFSLASTTCGTSLGVDASCTLTVKTEPTDSGNYTGNLRIVTNGGTIDVPLSVVAAMPKNQIAYVTPGSYTWTAPEGVNSVSVVAVGGGGVTSPTGGGGGGLGWKNNIPVTPGTKYTVVVGAAGSQSYFISNSLVAGLGGGLPAGGGFVGDGGGAGGNGYPGRTYNPTGGGGAGGYSGPGGNGGGGSPGTAGQGGGGGGGAGASDGSGGGGGVGLLGEGASGAGGRNSSYATGGQGGSGGSNGLHNSAPYIRGGGLYGGGGAGGGSGVGGGAGGSGAVRIIWPGDERLFPSTRTGNE